MCCHMVWSWQGLDLKVNFDVATTLTGQMLDWEIKHALPFDYKASHINQPLFITYKGEPFIIWIHDIAPFQHRPTMSENRA